MFAPVAEVTHDVHVIDRAVLYLTAPAPKSNAIDLVVTADTAGPDFPEVCSVKRDAMFMRSIRLLNSQNRAITPS